MSGFPSARINRSTVWSSPYELSSILSMAGVDTDLAVADGGTGAIRNNLSSGTYVVNIEEIGGDECSTTYILAFRFMGRF